MIKTLNENIDYNPVRPHINIGFTVVKEKHEKITFIVDDLIKKNFNESKSRVLIFVSTRDMAEDAADTLIKALTEKNLSYCDKVDYYHAGLEGSEREEKFQDYKNEKGEIVILIATKAFGMGMDIPNIHFVYHLEPSSNFEDFLQEVGRAGRNKTDYENAGFSEKNPIQTNCVIVKEDFKVLKDKLHKKEMTWGNIIQVQKTVYDYVNKYSKKELTANEAFALPTDLLGQHTEYSENKFDETFFRVILYWLEKLKKIKLGTYTPTHIPISSISENHNYSVIQDSDDVVKIKDLGSKLNAKNSEIKEGKNYLMLEMEELKDLLKVDTIKEIWRLLFLAQKAGVVKVEREIIIEPTKTRTSELEQWQGLKYAPTIETTFEFTKSIMYGSKYNQQTHFDEEELNRLGEEAIHKHINPQKIFWKEFTKKTNTERSPENIAKNLIKDFKTKRSRLSFKLINFLPECKHKSILNTEVGYDKARVTQLIYNRYKNSKDWDIYLQNFKSDLYKLINYIHDEKIKSDISKFNIVDLILKINIEGKGEEYFNQLIYAAKGLGYLKGNAGGIVPMGIELFILDKNIIDIDSLNQFEKSIKAEFEESVRMKLLRLLALECLSNPELISPKKYDSFIKSYFRCASETDFIKLFEEHFGENHESLKAFRAEALKKDVERLNPDQMKVYSASIDDNLQVIAGPGSGKTHTLILRVARLIQEENVNPENILVLAYNRAVVVELEDRLNKLFKELGYAKLIKRLNIYTFHGFCKKVLNEEADTNNFDNWITKFLQISKDTPGKLTQKIGLLKYVFVDEFQDITDQRLDFLKFIAKPTETKICVIGDPHQSIYGFQRVIEGGQMDPKPYYIKFEELYKPKEFYLSENRRSYQQVIDKADELLSLNTSKFDNMPKMTAFQGKGKEPVCELFDYDSDKTDWRVKLKELIEYKKDGKHFKDIALMFRSNIEVFRALNELKKMNISNVRIRVQGASGSLNKTREFHYFLNKIKEKGEEILPSSYFEYLKQFKQHILNELPNWDEYLIDVFLCITLEFKKEVDEDSTYQDLFEFISDISAKDDGQFGKIYSQNIHNINDIGNKTEIVLTTMHKVKGIEYDAVLIPACLTNFGIDHKGVIAANLQELYEEERRLYYVAYSRAKYKLVVIKWKKENALYSTTPLPVEILKPEVVKEKLGVLLEEGIDKFTLYWGASQYGMTSFESIRSQVKLGNEVKLKRRLQKNPGGKDFFVWEVFVNGNIVSQLSSNVTNKLADLEEVSGFIVSSVYVHTYEETLKSETGSQFASKWTNDSKERGYIYIIDFSGYGK